MAGLEIFRLLGLQMNEGKIPTVKEPSETGLQLQSKPVNRILLVDDDAGIRWLHTKILSRHYEVEEAIDGAVGWDAVQAKAYNLIITDNSMPKVSGQELIQKMYQAGLSVPVIMVTGNVPEFSSTRNPWLQGVVMLMKPVSGPTLLSTVKKVLSEIESKKISDASHLLQEKRIMQAEARTAVAEAKMEQMEIRSADELEHRVLERTEELEAFSYSVSHDLQVPLKHIAGMVKELQKGSDSAHSEINRGLLANISKSAKQMECLISDLLAFAHIGKSPIVKKEVNLNELVEETLTDFLAETKGQNIKWKVNPMPSVSADYALLRLVMINLFANAIKFTSKREEAEIEIGSFPDESGDCTVFVRDNGVGFDPEYTHKLFGVFQRLHNKDEFEGTGLGLSNVQRIIRRHGGRVWAEGKVDIGATIYFTIPKDAS
jgi:signal transduction histidine kinase